MKFACNDLAASRNNPPCAASYLASDSSRIIFLSYLIFSPSLPSARKSRYFISFYRRAGILWGRVHKPRSHNNNPTCCKIRVETRAHATLPYPPLPSPFKWRQSHRYFHSARYTHTHTDDVTNGCHIRSRYYDQIRSGNKRKDVANTRAAIFAIR